MADASDLTFRRTSCQPGAGEDRLIGEPGRVGGKDPGLVLVVVFAGGVATGQRRFPSARTQSGLGGSGSILVEEDAMRSGRGFGVGLGLRLHGWEISPVSLDLTRNPAPTAPIARLVERLTASGGGRIGMRGLLGDSVGLRRRARRTWAPGLAVRRCWMWDRHDRRDPTWFPQGVAHSWQTGYAEDVLLVSWYSKAGQGSRISVVDLGTGRYQHVGLVEVHAGSDGESVTTPMAVHAGGIVWHGRWLHVAATRRGFLTFDVDDLLYDPTGESGFDYLLPLRLAHQSSGDADGMRFSFLSLDRSASETAIVVGEYARASDSARLARYAVTPTGELAADAAGAIQAEVVGDGVHQMQGAVAVNGIYYLTVSHGALAPGEVVVGSPGRWRRRRFRTPPGPEDLAFHPPTDRFWSVTEHPGRRWLFSMPRSALRP